MRFTVNLEDDLYAVVRSLAKAEDLSLSESVNRLLRRALKPKAHVPQHDKSGLPTVHGARPFGPEDVAQIDSEF
jgi:hypothetical protein